MQCPTCDQWTTVCETRKGQHGTTKRARLCANGHRFSTIEISTATYKQAQPTILLSLQNIAARVLLWQRAGTLASDHATKNHEPLKKSSLFGKDPTV